MFYGKGLICLHPRIGISCRYNISYRHYKFGKLQIRALRQHQLRYGKKVWCYSVTVLSCHHRLQHELHAEVRAREVRHSKRHSDRRLRQDDQHGVRDQLQSGGVGNVWGDRADDERVGQAKDGGPSQMPSHVLAIPLEESGDQVNATYCLNRIKQQGGSKVICLWSNGFGRLVHLISQSYLPAEWPYWAIFESFRGQKLFQK